MTEREWREASDMRQSTVSLAAILAAAGALRFWALGAGIPYAVGIDEPEIMTRAVAMMKSGDFNPRFFDYPTLYIYVQVLTASARFMAGAMAGEWHSLAQVTANDFYLWGRSVTAVLGTLTVLLVYLIGLRWGTRPALLGAGLMAVMPMHVRESHYVLTDVPLTFFVALTMLLSLRAHEQPRAASFAVAGAAAGLAAATKYPGALALLLPLIAIWMTPAARPSRARGALALLGASAAAFLVAAPYTILDLPAFLNGYARLAGAYNTTPPSEAGWGIYLKHFRNSVEWPAFLLMSGGLILGTIRAIRGPGRVRWTLTIVFPIVFLWFISRQHLIFGRYLLPVTPFTSLLTATAVVSGVSLLRRFSIPRALRTGLIFGLTIAALLPAAVTSFRFNRTIAKLSTQALAYDWVSRNVPKDAKIVVEPGSPMFVEGQFRVRRVRQLREYDLPALVSEGTDYLIASSQSYGPFIDAPHLYPTDYARYMHIFERSQEVARFSPSSDHPGPELRIFKVQP